MPTKAIRAPQSGHRSSSFLAGTVYLLLAPLLAPRVAPWIDLLILLGVSNVRHLLTKQVRYCTLSPSLGPVSVSLGVSGGGVSTIVTETTGAIGRPWASMY